MNRALTLGIAAAIATGCASPPEPAATPFVTFTLTAARNRFNLPSIESRSGVSLVIRYVNADRGEFHGLSIRAIGPDKPVFTSDTFKGPDTRLYQLGALPDGQYFLACPIRSDMTLVLSIGPPFVRDTGG